MDPVAVVGSSGGSAPADGLPHRGRGLVVRGGLCGGGGGKGWGRGVGGGRGGGDIPKGVRSPATGTANLADVGATMAPKSRPPAITSFAAAGRCEQYLAILARMCGRT